jgi:ATP-dependent helicase/nuclease subunit A
LNEADEEARPFLNFTRQARTRARSAGTISAAEIGVAHHRFLEHLDWDRALEIVGLQAETERQCKGGILSLQEAAALDLPSIAAFFQSEFGQRLRSHAALVKRELEFTARFSLAELGEIGLIRNVSDSDEFVVIQGVADLVAVLPDALWIVDFKTDQIEPVEVEARLAEHRKQLRVYARAMERIFNRPAKECAVYFLALRRSEFIRLS